MTVVKPAEARTVDLLVASGVSYETWAPPLELTEHRGDGDPISHDELLDFHDLLQRRQPPDGRALASLLDR